MDPIFVLAQRTAGPLLRVSVGLVPLTNRTVMRKINLCCVSRGETMTW